jgi:hypothetical protein
MSTNRPSPYYESHEFTLATGTADVTLTSQSSTFPAVFKTTNDAPGRYASQMNLRTDVTVSIKLNSTSNGAITITSNDSPFKLEDVSISQIYLTNTSGGNAAVKILLTE